MPHDSTTLVSVNSPVAASEAVSSTKHQAPQLVIFDCDGVLVDSEPISQQVLMQMLAERGSVLSQAELTDQMVGISTPLFLQRIATVLGGTLPDDFLPEFRRRSNERFVRDLTVVPGIPVLLNTLAAAGINFCVASNGPLKKMEVTLGKTSLLATFKHRMFSAHDVDNPKPAPDVFLHAAQQLGVAPVNCVVIEDSATGVTAARAASIRVFGYAAQTPRHKLRDADVVFDNMAQVPSLLGI